MKLSKETIEILKNFSGINLSLHQGAGNEINVISPSKNILGFAKIKESFPSEFSIHDVNKFLGTVSLFDDPDFDFKEKSVRISNGTGAAAEYIFASKESVKNAIPPGNLQMPSVELTFTLEKVALAAAIKAASVMGLPNVTISGDGQDVYLSASDTANDSSHSWKQKVGTCSHSFKMIYRLDLLKLLPRDYTVSISERPITKFESADVTYFIAAEKNSVFNK